MSHQNFQYHVFFSHNSKDKPAVEWLAEKLEDEANLRVFLDVWNLVPGDPWQEDLEDALDQAQTVAVFLGPSGISSWHNEELRGALTARVNDPARRVIPVLLPGKTMPEKDEIPAFLARLTWVDFRDGLEDENAFHRLVSGITGKPPGRRGKVTKARRSLPPTPEPTQVATSATGDPIPGGVSVGNISGVSGGEVNIASGDIHKSTINIGGGTYVGSGVRTGGDGYVEGDKVVTASGKEDLRSDVKEKSRKPPNPA